MVYSIVVSSINLRALEDYLEASVMIRYQNNKRL